MTGPAVSLCSTYNLDVLQWWYDLAVKIFPVLLINSNRLVKKNFGFRYRASDMLSIYHLYALWDKSPYFTFRYQDPKQDLDLVGGRGEII